MSQRARRAKVIVPQGVELPREFQLPVIGGDLPDAHAEQYGDHYSYRGHARAHHRIVIQRPRNERYVMREVVLPEEIREFEPYMSHWQQISRNQIRVVHHYEPAWKVDVDMNRRRWDWKHMLREEIDHARADTLRALGHRNPQMGRLMYGALEKGSPGQVADTAIVVYNILER